MNAIIWAAIALLWDVVRADGRVATQAHRQRWDAIIDDKAEEDRKNDPIEQAVDLLEKMKSDEDRENLILVLGGEGKQELRDRLAARKAARSG